MLKLKSLVLAGGLLASFVFLPAGMALADTQSELQNGVDASGAQGTSQCTTNGVTTTVGPENTINCKIGTVVNILSSLVGVVAVIMVIVGGFRYITSGGDSNRVGSAKNTIIYALIGLVIVALAQILVRYVLHLVT